MRGRPHKAFGPDHSWQYNNNLQLEEKLAVYEIWIKARYEWPMTFFFFVRGRELCYYSRGNNKYRSQSPLGQPNLEIGIHIVPGILSPGTQKLPPQNVTAAGNQCGSPNQPIHAIRWASITVIKVQGCNLLLDELESSGLGQRWAILPVIFRVSASTESELPSQIQKHTET